MPVESGFYIELDRLRWIPQDSAGFCTICRAIIPEIINFSKESRVTSWSKICGRGVVNAANESIGKMPSPVPYANRIGHQERDTIQNPRNGPMQTKTLDGLVGKNGPKVGMQQIHRGHGTGHKRASSPGHSPRVPPKATEATRATM